MTSGQPSGCHVVWRGNATLSRVWQRGFGKVVWGIEGGVSLGQVRPVAPGLVWSGEFRHRWIWHDGVWQRGSRKAP
jgi:hypothetical protein